MADDDLTLLRLLPINLPPYSSRAIVQTIEPIPEAYSPAITATGKLINFAPPAFKKFTSTITCLDLYSPALSGVWPGDRVTVHCSEEWAFHTATGVQDRPAVPGSLYTLGEFTFYRMILYMEIKFYSASDEERSKMVNWTMNLQEVPSA